MGQESGHGFMVFYEVAIKVLAALGLQSHLDMC